jgi:hypothetical protein
VGLGVGRLATRSRRDCESWVGLVGILVGAAAGSLGTFITTQKRMRLEHRLSYDRDLRDTRLPHYQRLYHASGCIPREWRSGQEPPRQALLEMREISRLVLRRGRRRAVPHISGSKHVLPAAECFEVRRGGRRRGPVIEDVADRIEGASCHCKRSTAPAREGSRHGGATPVALDSSGAHSQPTRCERASCGANQRGRLRARTPYHSNFPLFCIRSPERSSNTSVNRRQSRAVRP